MSAIITDSFDYNDIVRVLDLDEAFVHHQIDALQPKYWAEDFCACDGERQQGHRLSDIHAEPRLADNKEAAITRLHVFRSIPPDGRLPPCGLHVS